jgi:hypothetical protein
VGRDAIPPYAIKLYIDPRTWEPGTATFTSKLLIPSNISAGAYQLALWLPDGYASLQDNPLYAIRFANDNVFDQSTGYNILGPINVNKAAGGSYQSGTKFEVIESTSSVQRSVSTTVTLESPSTRALISNPQISNDAENVYLSFDYASGEYNAFQSFVDTDQNPQTGYLINGIGAETIFENHTWNIYNGSGTDWNWAPTELLIQFEDSGSQVRWSVARELLHTSKFDAVFQLVDTNWNSAFLTSTLTYTLK